MMKSFRKFPIFIGVVLICTFLSSCSSSILETESDSLCLPDVEWGSSIDDTLAAFNTTREELGQDFYANGNSGSGYAILKGKTVFGVECTDMLLSFEMTADKSGSLIYAAIHYPKDAAMDTVMDEMKKVYGNPEETGRFRRYNEQETEEIVPDSPNRYWLGQEVIRSLSEEDLKSLTNIRQPYYFDYFTMIQWSTDYQIFPSANGEKKLSETPNVVILDARYLSEINKKLNPSY